MLYAPLPLQELHRPATPGRCSTPSRPSTGRSIPTPPCAAARPSTASSTRSSGCREAERAPAPGRARGLPLDLRSQTNRARTATAARRAAGAGGTPRRRSGTRPRIMGTEVCHLTAHRQRHFGRKERLSGHGRTLKQPAPRALRRNAAQRGPLTSAHDSTRSVPSSSMMNRKRKADSWR